jgi:polyisoprenoid-binding protein YceI
MTMKPTLTPMILALTLAAVLPWSVRAAEYRQVQADQSAITFVYQQMGVTMDGKFNRFTAQLSFDPERPESAKATVDVDLASIDTGSVESDQEVAGKAWFNTPAFPTARFTTSSVKALGDHRYEASGQLTIKGKTQDVVVPATFTAQGKAGVFEGRFTLRRGDFAIGEGPWAAFDVVANDVQIQFRITAQAGE